MGKIFTDHVSVRDALGQLTGTVRGRIVSLLKGTGYFYLLVETPQGIRPIQII
jgi:hypothetical protein